ncbi:MAG: hypothetical protein TRG1_2068 [Flavobacteriaceae bacterium FS1-H7996/R]|nr:MAG: hypothetical protein TRG1_2068 [Flavobacteriaceae bacterium FS1-H7996/R]
MSYEFLVLNYRLWSQTLNPEPRIQNLEHKTQNPEATFSMKKNE